MKTPEDRGMRDSEWFKRYYALREDAFCHSSEISRPNFWREIRIAGVILLVGAVVYEMRAQWAIILPEA
jgi:hypothetical protein